MLSMSKAFNATQSQDYHKLEYTSETQSYYKQNDAVEGEWQGKLAEQFGLTGSVTPEQFTRLTEGQHPMTGEPMVKHRAAQKYTNPHGSTTKAVEHRAGWDAMFAPPKSVSILLWWEGTNGSDNGTEKLLLPRWRRMRSMLKLA